MEGTSSLQKLQKALSEFAENRGNSKDSALAFSQCLLDSTAVSSPPRSSFSSPSRSSPPDEVYKIRNLDTGQEIDIRDENKADFVRRLATLLANENYQEALEAF